MDASRESDVSYGGQPSGPSPVRWTVVVARIISTYRMATSVPTLALAFAGAMLVPLGWWLAGAICLPSPPEGLPAEVQADRDALADVQADRALLASWPGFRRPEVQWDLGVWLARVFDQDQPLRSQRPGLPTEAAAREAVVGDQPEGAGVADPESAQPALRAPAVRWPFWYRAPLDPVVAVPYHLASPVFRLFDTELTWSSFFFYLLGGAWTIVVWTLFGGAICRIAAVRLGRDERVGFREAFVFGQRRWLGLIGAPCLPLLGIVLMGLPIILAGLFLWLMSWMQVTGIGLVLVGLAFPVLLLFGIGMAILALGLVFGWPLMWATIGAEGSDSFDAISRSYAYTFQCPARYFTYAVLAALVGITGWLITWFVAQAIVGLSDWGLDWGMGITLAEAVRQWREDIAIAPSAASRFGLRLMLFFFGLVWAAASAVAYSHFWCLATAVYLLLRRDADETELEDIYLEEERDVAFGLPQGPDTESPETSGTEADQGRGPAEAEPGAPSIEQSASAGPREEEPGQSSEA